MNEMSWREWIDACRPGQDDLVASELHPLAARLAADDDRIREAYHRTQAVDRRIEAAYHDVPVPAGLEARLLAGLQAAAPPAAVPQRRRLAGRRWWWAATALAAGLLLWLVVPPWGGTESFSTEMQLIEAALRWPEQLPADQWQLAENAPSSDAPPPPDSHLMAAVHGWQRSPHLPQSAVAYHVRGLDGVAAWLFVLPAEVAPVAAAQPPRQPFSTQGRNVAAWRHDRHVYVLVVDGPASRYRELVRPNVHVAALTRCALSRSA